MVSTYYYWFAIGSGFNVKKGSQKTHNIWDIFHNSLDLSSPYGTFCLRCQSLSEWVSEWPIFDFNIIKITAELW